MRLIGTVRDAVGRSTLQFQQFLLRGGVFEFMVAFAIAGAFATLIRDFVSLMLTPLLAAAFGRPNFSDMTFEVGGGIFRYGQWLNSLIAFTLIVLAVYAVVVAANALTSRAHHERPVDPSLRNCPECLAEIPRRARRCRFCTSEVTPYRTPERREHSSDGVASTSRAAAEASR